MLKPRGLPISNSKTPGEPFPVCNRLQTAKSHTMTKSLPQFCPNSPFNSTLAAHQASRPPTQAYQDSQTNTHTQTRPPLLPRARPLTSTYHRKKQLPRTMPPQKSHSPIPYSASQNLTQQPKPLLPTKKCTTEPSTDGSILC